MTATLVLLTFTLAADPIPKVAPEPLPPEPKRDPTNVRELYDAYRYYGLPLPPKGSYLAKRERKVTRVYQPGNREVVEDELNLALIRDDNDRTKHMDYKKADPTVELLKKNRHHIPPSFMTVNRWISTNEWLVFAAQAHHLGWKEAAQYGFEYGLTDLDFMQVESKTIVLDWLKTTAWRHQLKRLLEPDSDRREILKAMRLALCQNDKEFHEVQIEFHKDLERTVRLNWNRKGSPEDIIDEIVRGSKKADDLLALGFDAIPAVMRHLDDNRFTRETRAGGVNNSMHMYNARVGEICSSLLDTLFERDVSRYENINPDVVDDNAFRRIQAWETNEWLQQLRLYGEKHWCVDNVLQSYEKLYPENAYLNESVLVILREKYPDELTALIPKQRKRVVRGSIFLKAMASSGLSKEKKLSALRDAATNPASWHPLDVVRAWKVIDANEARKQFAAILDLAFRTDDLKQVVNREHDLTVLDAVHEFGDARLWKQFESVLPKIDARTCCSMINFSMSHSDNRSNYDHRKERISCLLKLLNNRTTLPAELEKDYGYMNINPVTLGHVAMYKLASKLFIEIPSKPDRTAEEWKTIREQIRMAAEKELLNK
jgi:hypothetical protein